MGYGNPDADVVIIITQGGPLPYLDTDRLFDIFSWVNFDETLFVNVHQTQTKTRDEFTERAITFDEAKSADSQSTGWLAETVQYYKDAGKQVYVVDISFSAFLVLDLLATQCNIADGYAIIVGRLDMPPEVWQVFAEGRRVVFKDGVELEPFQVEGDLTEANMAKLAADLGHKRYTQLSTGIDMHNVVYAYGMVDAEVGRLTQAEIDFLEAHGATVLRSDSDHRGTIAELTQPALEHLTQ